MFNKKSYGRLRRRLSATTRAVRDCHLGVFIRRYSRIPITATNAPEEQDFDQFISAIKDIPQLFDSNSSAPLPAMVFNCHVGQGRTTTGMVIGCLIMSHRTGFPSEAQ